MTTWSRLRKPSLNGNNGREQRRKGPGFPESVEAPGRIVLKHHGNRPHKHDRNTRGRVPQSCMVTNNVLWLVLICTPMGLFHHLHHTSLVSLLWLLPDKSGEKVNKHLDDTLCALRML